MNAGGEGELGEKVSLGLSMDVAALKDHLLSLGPLRIGSSALACRLADSTYSTYGVFQGRKIQPVVTLLPQKSNPTPTVRELQEAMFQAQQRRNRKNRDDAW